MQLLTPGRKEGRNEGYIHGPARPIRTCKVILMCEKQTLGSDPGLLAVSEMVRTLSLSTMSCSQEPIQSSPPCIVMHYH
jgi:hypothetical protein